MLRYIRQIVLSEIGIAGQKKFASSKVLIIGAGALGSPAAIYLAASGVGTIGIVDDDTVNLDNLHRQILHKTMSVGKPKTESARATILELNPDVIVKTYQVRLTNDNISDIFKDGYDLILDGSDNFETRYIANAFCVEKDLPFVMGSVLRFEGQMGIFVRHPRVSGDLVNARGPHFRGDDVRHFRGNDSPCYACLYPLPPPAEISPTCARAGVLGVIPGIIGTMQALEALKILAGFGEPLIGKLLIFDGLTCKMRVLEIKKDTKCKVCGD